VKDCDCANRVRIRSIVFPIAEFRVAVRTRLKGDFRSILVRAPVIIFKADDFTQSPAVRLHIDIKRSQLILGIEFEVAFIFGVNSPLLFTVEIGCLVPAGKYHVLIFHRDFFRKIRVEPRHIMIKVGCRIAFKSMECHVVPRSSRIFNGTRKHRVRIHPDVLSPYRTVLAHVQGKRDPSIGKFIFMDRYAAHFPIGIPERFLIQVITVYNCSLIERAKLANIQNKMIPPFTINISGVIAIHNTDLFIIANPSQSGSIILRFNPTKIIAVFYKQVGIRTDIAHQARCITILICRIH
jgi:hypothetical protein